MSDIIEANRRIVALLGELKATSVRLKAASIALVTADKYLLEANAQLVRLVDELSLANEKLVKASEQVSKSGKMQMEFINIAAHELRTPIQPILAVMDLYDINPLLKKIRR